MVRLQESKVKIKAIGEVKVVVTQESVGKIKVAGWGFMSSWQRMRRLTPVVVPVCPTISSNQAKD